MSKKSYTVMCTACNYAVSSFRKDWAATDMFAHSQHTEHALTVIVKDVA